MMLKKIAVFFLLFIINLPAFATEKQYTIIIDAGSSGSRLHLFEHANFAFPLIKELFSEKISIPLASFTTSEDPKAPGNSLKPLIDHALNYLVTHQINPHTVAIYVYSTGGMRALPIEEHTRINNNVMNFLKEQYSSDFAIEHSTSETITGEREGIYDWLDINYLADTFVQDGPSVGIIDMGGASTQIAFERKKPSSDVVELSINHKKYYVTSKSFLGLGQDYSRNSINTYPTAPSCYPTGYPLHDDKQGQFDFDRCAANFDQLIGKYHVSDIVTDIPADMRFTAFSGAYYTFNFFNADQSPNPTILKQHIIETCQQSWDSLEKQYPGNNYVYAYCAAGVYMNNLFYNTYQLTADQLRVASQINGQSLDWTLGAMLYQLITL